MEYAACSQEEGSPGHAGSSSPSSTRRMLAWEEHCGAGIAEDAPQMLAWEEHCGASIAEDALQMLAWEEDCGAGIAEDAPHSLLLRSALGRACSFPCAVRLFPLLIFCGFVSGSLHTSTRRLSRAGIGRGAEEEARGIVSLTADGNCSGEHESCLETMCCRQSGQNCYVKNETWAGCLKSCTEADENWSCLPATPLGHPPVALDLARLRGPRADGAWPRLFCYSVIRADTYEFKLLQQQFALHASIFGCEAWSVLSDREFVLSMGPPIVSTIALGDLSRPSGLRTHFANTDIFSRAFDLLQNRTSMMDYDFIVKADPDAVFVPSRLKKLLRADHLADLKSSDKAVYFLNCDFQDKLWMFGALEVLSRGAVAAYFKDRDNKCKPSLDYDELGEDTFLMRCLDLLNVEARKDTMLLSDGYCAEAPGTCSSKQAAYHPFKDVGAWLACFTSAQSNEDRAVD